MTRNEMIACCERIQRLAAESQKVCERAIARLDSALSPELEKVEAAFSEKVE